MNFYIANPNSGVTPAYDGFNGRVWMTAVKADSGNSVPVSSYVEWIGANADVNQAGAVHVKDLKPASAYDDT